MNSLIYMIKRDFLLAVRQRAELINPLLFYLLVIILFPLGLGQNPKLLTVVAPVVIWIAALLAVLMSIERMFRSDFLDGTLEQLILCRHSLALLVLGKIVAHWLVTGLPLILVTPLIALLLNISMEQFSVLLVTLLLGTPALSAIGAIGVALTVGLRRGGILLALIVMPLYTPVLIFATRAMEHAAQGWSIQAELAMLIALFVLSLTLAPLPTAAALKVSTG